MSIKLEELKCKNCGSPEISTDDLICHSCGTRYFINVLAPALHLADQTDSARVPLPKDRDQVLDWLLLAKFQEAARKRNLAFESTIRGSDEDSVINFLVRLPGQESWDAVAHVYFHHGRYVVSFAHPPVHGSDYFSRNEDPTYISWSRGMTLGQRFYTITADQVSGAIFRGENDLTKSKHISSTVASAFKFVDDAIERAKPKPAQTKPLGFLDRLFGSA